MSSTLSAELSQREAPRRAPPEAAGARGAAAVVLRPDDRPLLAFHHVPRGAQQRSVGFVLCNTVGYDSMCAYRTYRHAAELLAQAGFPALRFDYLGTGNSAAGEGRCAEDIGAAIDALKERSGVSSVVLMGMRAGALLAAGVAAVRTDVAGLALLATPPSGRAFVRELKAFQATSGEPPGPDGALKVAGFSLSRALVAELSALDPQGAVPARPMPVLVLRRDDLEGEERLAQKWTAAGHAVTFDTLGGYTAMMSMVETSVVPTAALERLRSWAADTFTARQPRVEPAPDAAPVRWACGDVTETAVRFGVGAGMFGVVSAPPSGAVRAGRRRAVVLLNTGANHLIGPGGLTVALARALAAAGLTVLRFDRRGLGESHAAPDEPENVIYSPSSTADVPQALRFLRAHAGAEEFVLAGICSGAYLSFRAALAEPQVVGALLVNPPLFEPPDELSYEERIKGSFKPREAYVRAALERETWQRLFTGQVAVLRLARHLVKSTARQAWAEAQSRWTVWARPDAPTNPVERDFRALSARNARAQLVYSEQDPTIDVLAPFLGALGERMRGRAGFSVELVPGADHTFTRSSAQQALTALVLRFAQG